MAAGIPVSKETTSETQLDGSAFEMGPEFVLPHQLPRPAHVPTAAPPPVEPLYQPQHGKPIGTFFFVCRFRVIYDKIGWCKGRCQAQVKGNHGCFVNVIIYDYGKARY